MTEPTTQIKLGQPNRTKWDNPSRTGTTQPSETTQPNWDSPAKWDSPGRAGTTQPAGPSQSELGHSKDRLSQSGPGRPSPLGRPTQTWSGPIFSPLLRLASYILQNFDTLNNSTQPGATRLCRLDARAPAFVASCSSDPRVSARTTATPHVATRHVRVHDPCPRRSSSICAKRCASIAAAACVPAHQLRPMASCPLRGGGGRYGTTTRMARLLRAARWARETRRRVRPRSHPMMP